MLGYGDGKENSMSTTIQSTFEQQQHFEITRKWTAAPQTSRECGSCYACCVHLGIKELKKYTGQTCKHLNGASGPTKRCSIYQTRPGVCSQFKCFWLIGWGPDYLRPSECGILISAYNSDKLDKIDVTVTIFDEDKAKPYVKDVIAELAMLPAVDEMRVIYTFRKKALLFRDGDIYECRLLPQYSCESITFEAEMSKPVGTYAVLKKDGSEE